MNSTTAPVALASLEPLLKKLRSVHAVSVIGSTAGAAEALHLSQSAVVRAIQDVEGVLGFALFDRSPRGMAATVLGELVARRAGRAFDLLARSDPNGLFLGGRDARGPAPRLSWQRSRLASTLGSRHVNVFLTLAQAGSEPRAASRLGISQSAVHQTLGQIEHLAGEALFHRARTGLRLVEGGEMLRQGIKLMLAELNHARDDVAAAQGALHGRLVIGTLPFSTGLFVPRALDTVLEHHPALTVTVVDGTFETLLHQLRYAEIDVIVGALRDPPPSADVVQETLFEDRLAVVARRDHPLTRQRPAGLKDLQGLPWVLPMPGTPAQAAFDEAFRAEGLPSPRDRLRVNSAVMMQALVLSSDRLALMSARQLVREVEAGLLVVLPLAVRHGPRRIGITTRSGFLPSPGMGLLLDALRSSAQTLNTAPTAEQRRVDPRL